ncbi:MAG: Dyp-type peroxidase [Chloroflexi bacterium]|nr:Dyp-type peroxidase [Chloroflexota bacterium]
MTVPQFGIFAQGTIAHEFIEFDLRPDVDMARATTALSQLRAPAVAAGGINLVIGFGSELWKTVAPDQAPADLANFAPIGRLGGHHAPATQHDFWLWISGSSQDVVFEHARAAVKMLTDVATVASERPCFVHRDSRDLTGFIDGSANPMTHEAPAAALIPDGQPGEGGAHVIVMRWVHDLDAFEQLPRQEQERVFGRSKQASIEMTGDALPADAHIARVQISDPAGEELPIYRRSVPYGTVAEHGLYFVAFSADRTRFDRMLARMFGTDADQIHDHLTDFSRPVTGSFYFAPSLTCLAELGERWGAAAVEAIPSSAEPAGNPST